jgi:hypothetical protein
VRAVQHCRGATDPRVHRYGRVGAVERAGPAFDAGISVDDLSFSTIDLEDGMRTDHLTRAAAIALALVKLKRYDSGQISQSLHPCSCRM